MANTYTQIHIQAIFGVKYRTGLIHPEWKEELHKYITGIVQNHNHKVLQINSMPDHVHLLFGMRPNQALSDLMREVKSSSSEWISQNRFMKGNFKWQAGYGAFSYGKSQVPNVIRYIQNQEKHHQKKTFLQEYQDFLDAFEVDYNEQYIFEPLI